MIAIALWVIVLELLVIAGLLTRMLTVLRKPVPHANGGVL